MSCSIEPDRVRLRHFAPHPGRQDGWCRLGGRQGCPRRVGDGLVDGHGVGGLNPHPDVIGLVEGDGNGVEAEEIGGDQDAMGGVVRGQFCRVGITATALL